MKKSEDNEKPIKKNKKGVRYFKISTLSFFSLIRLTKSIRFTTKKDKKINQNETVKEIIISKLARKKITTAIVKIIKLKVKKNLKNMYFLFFSIKYVNIITPINMKMYPKPK
jgi:hypothetical protein